MDLKFRKYSVKFVCLLLVLVCSVNGKKNHYRAAVFEYNTYRDDSLGDNLIINLQAYETATRTASQNVADIIVFPEDGLYPGKNFFRNNTAPFSEHIPNPKLKHINPCEQARTFMNRPILFKLSCLAKENRIYIVANMIDFNKCPLIQQCNVKDTESFKDKDCPDDGMLLYNTNVVFDREGTLIARYYKKHLFFEYDRDLPKIHEDVFFDTDFGKFTTFVCFDLIFNESVKAIEKSGVVNVAYPTYWFDYIPFMYFATPFQQAWAIGNNVNLLAADGHDISTGSLGSGIYSGSQGALVYTDSPDNLSRLLISNVPKIPSEKLSDFNVKRFIIDGTTAVEEKTLNSENFKGNKCQQDILGPSPKKTREYRCKSLNTTNYRYLKLSKPEDTIELCANGMCCNLSYKTKYLNDVYFLGVFGNTLNLQDIFKIGIEGCFFVRCDSSDGKECKQFVLKSNTVFDHIELKGNISSKYVFPYAIDSDVRLTDKKKWTLEDKSEIRYRNQDKTSSLLFLALYGRNFEQDIDKFAQSQATTKYNK